MGPDERRGIADLNGEGEMVSGIVVARYGQNALDVIAREFTPSRKSNLQPKNSQVE